MEINRDKIADRIRRMLGKANAEGSTEAEAEQFTAKAQELLARYNIDISEVEKSGEDKMGKPVRDQTQKTKVRPRYRTVRMWCARMFFCEYYFIQQGDQDINVYIGAPHNIEVAKLMSEYLQKTVWRMAVEHSKSVPQKQRNKYRDSFADACSNRLGERMRERIAKTMEQETISHVGGSNLPVLASLYDTSRQRNQQLMVELGIKLRIVKAKSKRVNYDGYADGRKAGDTISLDRQIGGGQNFKRIQ